MKKYLIIAIAFIVLLGGIGFLIIQNRTLRTDNDRQSGNVSTLMGDVKKYRVRDSLNVVSKSELNLTLAEFKKYRADDAKLIEDLGIKNKYLESITKVSTEAKDTIPAEKWKPSKELPDCLEYSDKWSSITACFKDTTVMYSFRDSLALAVHRIPKYKFLWLRWGTKGYRVEVVNFNPKSKIGYSEIVRIGK